MSSIARPLASRASSTSSDATTVDVPFSMVVVKAPWVLTVKLKTGAETQSSLSLLAPPACHQTHAVQAAMGLKIDGILVERCTRRPPHAMRTASGWNLLKVFSELMDVRM